MRHVTIPVFVPGAACPFQCIFCDQEKITGRVGIPREEIRDIILRNLSTINPEETNVEVGFFGGTFTGLPFEEQEKYFEAVIPFIKEGKINSIRLSTRPDFISAAILSFLKKFPVRTIELGAQSMDDEVLKKSFRGHTSEDTVLASKMILANGFRLGLQMMIGLPGDTRAKAIETAREIIRLGAHETRIYPVVVIRGTALEQLYNQGKYEPLPLEEAVSRTKDTAAVFNEAGINILRIGLHPSEGMLSKTDLVAGPFHPSFRELVMTAAWLDRFSCLLTVEPGNNINIKVNPADLNAAIGYSAKNRKVLQRHYKKVKFIQDPAIKEGSFHADHC